MNPPVTEVVAVEQEESAKTMSRMSHEQATNLFAPPTALPRPVSSTTNNVRRLTTSVRTPAK